MKNLLNDLMKDHPEYAVRRREGILPLEKAMHWAVAAQRIWVISSRVLNVFFFTDINNFGLNRLPDHFVCKSISWIESSNAVEAYAENFEAGKTRIDSVGELLYYLLENETDGSPEQLKMSTNSGLNKTISRLTDALAWMMSPPDARENEWPHSLSFKEMRESNSFAPQILDLEALISELQTLRKVTND